MNIQLSSLFLPLLIGVAMAAGDICSTHGSPCRAPFGLNPAYEALFSYSCHRHSICYSCGAKAGLTKQQCDDALQDDMYRECDGLSQPDLCRFQADNVLALQTRVVGTNFFHQERYPDAWCVEHGIETCMPSVNSTTTIATATTTPSQPIG